MININFEPFPELTTNRLVLRQLTPEDEIGIFTIRSNAVIAEYLDRPLYTKLEEAREFIEKINRGIKHNEWIYWAICLKENSKLIGTICLWKISEGQSKAEIGFELLPEYHGKGIMTQAVSKVLEYGFNTMNLHIIDGEVAPNNKKSIKLMKKFNFEKIENTGEQLPENGKTIIYRLPCSKYI